MPTLYGYPVCSCIVASAPLVERRFREAGLIRQSFDGLISQGCYSAGSVSASKGTHDGGGVLDLTDFTPYRTDADLLFTACGWVAFYRPYGVLYARSAAHWHVVLNGCPHLAQGAANQIRDAKAGLNGLAGKGKDEGPRPLVTWQQALAEDAGITFTETTEDDDMILIQSPGRASALIAAGYSRELKTQEEIDAASSICRVVVGNDRQWDLWLAACTQGNLIPSVGETNDPKALAAAIAKIIPDAIAQEVIDLLGAALTNRKA